MLNAVSAIRGVTCFMSVCFRSAVMSNAPPTETRTVSFLGVWSIRSSPASSSDSSLSRWNTRTIPAGSGMPRPDAASFSNSTVTITCFGSFCAS